MKQYHGVAAKAAGLSPTVEPASAVSPAVAASIPNAARNARGTVFWISVEEATTPVSGECIVGYWWSVHPEHGLAFYANLTGYGASENPSPQCNQSEFTSKTLTAKLWPDHECRQVPVVYRRHADRAMAKLKAQAIEARRAATLGAVHESAVRQDAPTPSVSTPSSDRMGS